MGQISINSIGTAPALPTSAPASPLPADRALNRTLSAAARAVNDAGFVGEGREVTFSVDPATKRPVIKVVDSVTREVIQQWPREYLLQIAAETSNQKGVAG